MAIARKNAKTNKRAALQAIKRKKRFEKQLGQIDGTLTTLEQQREALEGANTNTAVLQVPNESMHCFCKQQSVTFWKVRNHSLPRFTYNRTN